ncbi:MAG: DUF2332 domain-containing protein [Anaerolineales bacterium]|nr:DUF2332 domain-containing protein [Anaerolineales bacterium]
MNNLHQRFHNFAEKECVPASPLYARLARGVAEDEALLELAAHTQSGQPAPNMLFAAVQFLLLRQPTSALAQFYPTIATHPHSLTHADPFPLWREFCLSHRAEIETLLQTRLVQTNEVRRCALLLPAFAQLPQPLALIEVGASAGLNLLWDQYRYQYSDGRSWGQADSGVTLTCEWRGPVRPPLPPEPVQVAARLGLDLNPLDINNAEDVAWLRALIWPELVERARLLENALQVAQAARPTVWCGDAVPLLPQAFAQAPAEATLCVWHSFTLNQFAPEARAAFTAQLAAAAAQRPLYKIGLEWGTDCALLSLSMFTAGEEHTTLLAHCDPHGAWLEWLVE